MVATGVQIRSVDLANLVVGSNLPYEATPDELRCDSRQRNPRYDFTDDEHLVIFVPLEFVANDLNGKEVFSVVAIFRAVYSLPGLPAHTPEDLQSFARLNGTFNVWPYWRELLQSTGNRVGLAGITVPVYRPGEHQGTFERTEEE